MFTRRFGLSQKYHNLKAFNEVFLKYIILKGARDGLTNYLNPGFGLDTLINMRHGRSL
jgi:hypothetical protein